VPQSENNEDADFFSQNNLNDQRSTQTKKAFPVPTKA
jgi:hypothetical protein